MVFAEKFIERFEQLWKCQYNEYIIDLRSHKEMGFEQFEERNHFRLCSVESGPKSRTRYKRIQSTCYNFLERPNGVFSVSYHFALFGLVVVGLVFAILETMDELKHNSSLMLGTYILEVFLLIVFTSEYILRMWSAGCRSTYSGVLGRLRFAFKPFVIVDMIVIGSTFGVIIYSSNTINLSSTISMLRFFQVLRMVRFDRQGASWKLLGSVLFLHRQELLTTFYIGFCSLIFASFFVYQAEHVDNAEDFATFADSFWWGVVTLTTVGYGDKVPRSWAGRGVAAFFAIMGISFFALPAGILGSGFALKVSKQQRQKHVKRRRRPAAMLIQCNWRYYASRKNSKLNATWSPYIKYLQEKNSKNDDHRISEKTSQPVTRVRKISIFGRKASGLSSDGLSRPAGSTTPEQVRQRSHKVARSELFQSNESLQDRRHSNNSTADQHTDDEHGGSRSRHKPILVSDDHGNPSLPAAYKQSIRFTRYLKFLVALRKFKLAKKPYDVKDVIEQYSTGHVEVLGKVKSIGHKIDEALGYKVGTAKLNENPPARTNVVHRLSKLEKQVKTLENKLDLVISLLEDAKGKDGEERLACTVCGHSNSQHSEQGCNEGSKESHQKPVRRRKLAATLTNQSNDSLCEREELFLNEEKAPRASLKSGESLEHCLENNNYYDCSLKTDDIGLSPSYGYLDENDGTNNMSLNSWQSSRYGVSDNCHSPTPSSSDESCQSKDMFDHDGQKSLLPSDNPLHGGSFGGTFVEIPVSDFMLTELFDKQNTSGYGYKAGQTFAGPSTATVPSIPDDTGVNQYLPIPGLIYQSQQDYISEPGLSSSDVTYSKSQPPSEDGELVKPDDHEKEISVEDKPLSGHGQVYENYGQECPESSSEKSHGDYQLRHKEPVMQASLEQANYPQRSPSFSCDNLFISRPRADSAFFSVDSANKKPDDHSLEISSESDSELSNRSTDERSHESDVTPGIYNKNHIQETRM